MSKVDLISEELWCHYSGLPSPAWYQYRKKLNGKEDNTEDSTNLETPDEKI